jgi:hypothetical protein
MHILRKIFERLGLIKRPSQPVTAPATEPKTPEPPRLSKDITRTLTCLRPTLFPLYREIKGQDGVSEVIADFDQRIRLIGLWTARRAAEDQETIEATVRCWHDRDVEYEEKFPDFSARFNHLRRSYQPIIPADEIADIQPIPVEV